MSNWVMTTLALRNFKKILLNSAAQTVRTRKRKERKRNLVAAKEKICRIRQSTKTGIHHSVGTRFQLPQSGQDGRWVQQKLQRNWKRWTKQHLQQSITTRLILGLTDRERNHNGRIQSYKWRCSPEIVQGTTKVAVAEYSYVKLFHQMLESYAWNFY